MQKTSLHYYLSFFLEMSFDSQHIPNRILGFSFGLFSPMPNDLFNFLEYYGTNFLSPPYANGDN